MKKASGEILWIDEECVGYKCECGNDDLIIGIYGSESNRCEKCGKKYHLSQINIVYELEDKEEI